MNVSSGHRLIIVAEHDRAPQIDGRIHDGMIVLHPNGDVHRRLRGNPLFVRHPEVEAVRPGIAADRVVFVFARRRVGDPHIAMCRLVPAGARRMTAIRACRQADQFVIERHVRTGVHPIRPTGAGQEVRRKAVYRHLDRAVGRQRRRAGQIGRPIRELQRLNARQHVRAVVAVTRVQVGHRVAVSNSVVQDQIVRSRTRKYRLVAAVAAIDQVVPCVTGDCIVADAAAQGVVTAGSVDGRHDALLL